MSEITERLDRLPQDRRTEFLALLRNAMQTPERRGPTPRQRSGPARLSFAQETLWFLDRLAPGLPTYNVPFRFRVRGRLDLAALREALTQVVNRHETLRTYLTEEAEGPVQIVVPDIAVELPVTDVDGTDPMDGTAGADGGDGGDDGERHARARRLAEEIAREPFDLSTAPLWRARLIRVAEDDHLLVFVVHHVVFDGWSLGAFVTELAEFYRAARRGERPHLEPLPIQYPDFAEWQREWLEGAFDELAEYWRERLAGVPVLEFPTDRPRPATATYAGVTAVRIVAPDATEGIQRLARQEGVTAYTVYLAVFFALLHRYSGQDDLVIGSPSANRGRPEVEPLIGFFINMLVLRVDTSGDPTFRELVDRLRDVVLDAFDYGELPFEKLVDAVRPVRDPSRSPLFQIAFTLQNASGEPLRLDGLQVEQEVFSAGASRFDMSWSLTADDRGLEVSVESNTDLFDQATIEQLMAQYERILRAVVVDPGMPLSRLPLLDAATRQDLLRAAVGPPRDTTDRATIAELFERRVAAAPDQVALVVEGAEIDYAELNRRANRLAHLLRRAGAAPGERVALCLPRGADLIVAVLGILKSGAAYLPLDPTHPPARLAGIIQDAGPRAIVTTSRYPDRLPADGPRLIRLDADTADLMARPDTNPEVTVAPEDLAYVLYTSGSTGKPKGVLIEHRNVVNFIGSVQELFELTPADRVLGYASITFDVSVFEIFSALLSGARLYLATDEERLGVERLQDLMERAGITVIDLPPAMMELLEPERFDALRIVFAGGEAFSGALVNRWNPGRRFFNGYGPTECTVTMIVEECPGIWDASPPIGRPMAGQIAHVLDKNLEPVPYGVPGELVIGGAGLARGYLNRPELTAEKFIGDPFGTAPDGRLYRTGDLVKRLRDGRLVFLSRIDQQVKIRGLRIELGEIESLLSAHPAVGQATAEPWTDERGDKHLVAYVTPAESGDLDLGELRSHLADHLPVYMIPAYFVRLDEMPLNASGKVDRRLLPAPDTSRPIGDEAAPRGETERILIDEVFLPILGLQRLGIHDDFFELGGNSLQAAQLISRIQRRFTVEVRLADFFRAPTVAGLAALVDREQAGRMDDEQLLAMLESMPEDEVARLLGGTKALDDVEGA